MGLFDFLKSNSKEDETYLLSSLLLFILGKSDGDFSKSEQEVFTNYIQSLPPDSATKIQNAYNNSDINYDEILSKCKELKEDDKLKLLNYSVGMIVADGIITEDEISVLKEICEMINADFTVVKQYLLEKLEIDIDNLNHEVPNNKDNNSTVDPIMGFRSHHKASDSPSQEEFKFCTQCGQKNNLVSKFCLKCGETFNV